jgi:D-ribose pyranose/furanose isomerase RbsD
MFLKYSTQSMPILATYNPSGNIVIKASALAENLGDDFRSHIVEQKDPRFVYAIARAVTADVPNKNHDMFPLDEIKRAYTTFIGRNIFLDHNTKSVRNAVGKIIAAELREDEEGHTYVACLFKVDRELHPDIARKIENGIIDSVSMGANVQVAECSKCGQQASREADFCDHMKNMYMYSDVYSINHGVEFTELSLVSVPADPTAHMHKVFNMKGGMEKVAVSPEAPATDLSPKAGGEDPVELNDVPLAEAEVELNQGIKQPEQQQETALIKPDPTTLKGNTAFYKIDCASNEAADLIYNILSPFINKGIEELTITGRGINVTFEPEVKDVEEFMSDCIQMQGLTLGKGIANPVTASLFNEYLHKEAGRGKIKKDSTTINGGDFSVDITVGRNEKGLNGRKVELSINSDTCSDEDKKKLIKVLQQQVVSALGNIVKLSTKHMGIYAKGTPEEQREYCLNNVKSILEPFINGKSANDILNSYQDLKSKQKTELKKEPTESDKTSEELSTLAKNAKTALRHGRIAPFFNDLISNNKLQLVLQNTDFFKKEVSESFVKAAEKLSERDYKSKKQDEGSGVAKEVKENDKLKESDGKTSSEKVLSEEEKSETKPEKKQNNTRNTYEHAFKNGVGKGKGNPDIRDFVFPDATPENYKKSDTKDQVVEQKQDTIKPETEAELTNKTKEPETKEETPVTNDTEQEKKDDADMSATVDEKEVETIVNEIPKNGATFKSEEVLLPNTAEAEKLKEFFDNIKIDSTYPENYLFDLAFDACEKRSKQLQQKIEDGVDIIDEHELSGLQYAWMRLKQAAKNAPASIKKKVIDAIDDYNQVIDNALQAYYNPQSVQAYRDAKDFLSSLGEGTLNKLTRAYYPLIQKLKDTYGDSPLPDEVDVYKKLLYLGTDTPEGKDYLDSILENKSGNFDIKKSYINHLFNSLDKFANYIENDAELSSYFSSDDAKEFAKSKLEDLIRNGYNNTKDQDVRELAVPFFSVVLRQYDPIDMEQVGEDVTVDDIVNRLMLGGFNNPDLKITDKKLLDEAKKIVEDEYKKLIDSSDDKDFATQIVVELKEHGIGDLEEKEKKFISENTDKTIPHLFELCGGVLGYLDDTLSMNDDSTVERVDVEKTNDKPKTTEETSKNKEEVKEKIQDAKEEIKDAKKTVNKFEELKNKTYDTEVGTVRFGDIKLNNYDIRDIQETLLSDKHAIKKIRTLLQLAKISREINAFLKPKNIPTEKCTGTYTIEVTKNAEDVKNLVKSFKAECVINKTGVGSYTGEAKTIGDTTSIYGDVSTKDTGTSVGNILVKLLDNLYMKLVESQVKKSDNKMSDQQKPAEQQTQQKQDTDSNTEKQQSEEKKTESKQENISVDTTKQDIAPVKAR